MQPSHPSSVSSVQATSSPDLAQVLEEAKAVLHRIRELHRGLADAPEPGGAAEAELWSLIQARREMATVMGQAMTRWLASGGEILLTSPPCEDPERVAATDVDQAEPDGAMDAALPETVSGDGTDAALTEAAPGDGMDAALAEVAPDDGADDALPGSPSDCEPAAERVAEEPTVVVAAADEAEAPPSPRPRASQEALLALQAQGLGAASTATPTYEDALRALRALRRLLNQIGPPARLKTLGRAEALLSTLEDVVQRIDDWRELPRASWQGLLGLVSSLARHLQEETSHELDTHRFPSLFSRMTRWSGKHQPGYVEGLGRKNSSLTESWLEDARHWWVQLQAVASPEQDDTKTPGTLLQTLREHIEDGVDDEALVKLVRRLLESGLTQSDPQLVQLLSPRRAAFKRARGLKTLRSRLKQASKGKTPPVPPSTSTAVPEDWPFYAQTEDKVVVILGGDPRPEAKDRIAEAFRFREVTWETTDSRRVQSVRERVLRHSVDMVVLLRQWLSHTVSDAITPACDQAGVPFVVVDTGYGVTQVRLGIERYLNAKAT